MSPDPTPSPTPLPPNAALMPDGSIKFCGVLVRPGVADKPCVLSPGHDGECVFNKKEILGG